MQEARPKTQESRGSQSLEQVPVIRLSSRLQDPTILGTAALVIGFGIGTGQWKNFRRELLSIGESLGALVMVHISDSFRRKNARYLRT